MISVGWAIVVASVVAAWLVLLWANKLPHVKGIKYLLSALNDAGGHIFVLLILTLVTFYASLHLFYHAIDLIVNKRIAEENGVMMMGLTWASGQAFGLFAGALLKTMIPSTQRASMPGREEPAAPNPSAVPVPTPEVLTSTEEKK